MRHPTRSGTRRADPLAFAMDDSTRDMGVDGFLTSNRSAPSGRMCRRSLSSGGRKKQRQRRSRPGLSLGATRVAACRLNAWLVAQSSPLGTGPPAGWTAMRKGWRLLARPAGATPAVAAASAFRLGASFRSVLRVAAISSGLEVCSASPNHALYSVAARVGGGLAKVGRPHGRRWHLIGKRSARRGGRKPALGVLVEAHDGPSTWAQRT